MKATAKQNYIHVSSRKAKLVVDLIRGKNVIEASQILENVDKKTGPILFKLLHQAISNATNNHAMDSTKLYVYHVVANQAPTLKRTNPRARGSADLLRKRYTHLEIVLSDDENERKNDLKKIKDKISIRAKNNSDSIKKRKLTIKKDEKLNVKVIKGNK